MNTKHYALLLVLSLLTGCAFTESSIHQESAGQKYSTQELFAKADASVSEMRLEDVSVTVSPNIAQLNNFKVLVGPVWEKQISRSRNIPDDNHKGNTTLIETGFIRAGFTLVDRNLVENILSEMYLQQTGVISAQDVAKLGKISGAGIILTGKSEISSMGNEIWEMYCNYDLKAVSVESGEILAIASYSGVIKKGFGRGVVQVLASELSKYRENKGEREMDRLKNCDFISMLHGAYNSLLAMEGVEFNKKGELIDTQTGKPVNDKKALIFYSKYKEILQSLIETQPSLYQEYCDLFFTFVKAASWPEDLTDKLFLSIPNLKTYSRPEQLTGTIVFYLYTIMKYTQLNNSPGSTAKCNTLLKNFGRRFVVQTPSRPCV